jgi:hypothetical protein
MTDKNGLAALKQPRKSFLREYWYVWFLAGMFILFAIAQVLRSLTPPPPPPDQANTWQGITPGVSKIDQIQQKLGQPIGVEETTDGSKLSYTSHYPSIPNQVVVDKTGTVSFIREQISYDPNHNLQTYLTQYGQPDLQLFYDTLGDGTRANVFLDEGVVIMTHPQNSAVLEKWYFTPTTQELFMQSWGTSLSAEYEVEQFGQP